MNKKPLEPAKEPGIDAPWSPEQERVITASPTARLLVEAGPGTGKTAVACARIAHLLAKGCVPSRIWLISFTRTAVQEVRNRIARLAKGNRDVGEVRVATIDSSAWMLHHGFEQNAVFCDYDENIRGVLDLINSDRTDVAEFLEGIEHLVVDEAQDMVGVRAELVLTLIRHLPSHCGVTVFADSAQAIYGFANGDGDGDDEDGPTLPELLRSEQGFENFEGHELKEVHRTSEPGLIKIFTTTRRRIIEGAKDEGGLHRDVVEDVRKWAQPADKDFRKLAKENRDVLILYRRRAEVLMASSFLCDDGLPHRVRMSGLPDCLPAWSAKLFWDHVGQDVSRTEFESRWKVRIETSMEECSRAWDQCLRVAGRQGAIVSMKKLREVLGRKRPPITFCSPDFGTMGPIVGTIHASKGREANSVLLMMPKAFKDEPASDEEARVVFVGATRARLELIVSQGFGSGTSKQGDRIFRTTPKKGKAKAKAQIELGIRGDLHEVGLVGRANFDTELDARLAQKRIATLSDLPVGASALRVKGRPYRYWVVLAGDDTAPILALSKQVNDDLWEIGKRLGHQTKLKPSARISNVWLRGARSIVLRPDDSAAEGLHPPYCNSGFLLAPLLLAYPTISFW